MICAMPSPAIAASTIVLPSLTISPASGIVSVVRSASRTDQGRNWPDPARNDGVMAAQFVRHNWLPAPLQKEFRSVEAKAQRIEPPHGHFATRR
jgi:hypothetical protein